MISWVKPKILIPVHGEALHLSEHAALARSLGVPEVISCRNGDVVKLSGVAGVIDEIPAGRFYKDGKLLVDSQSRTVSDRCRLSFAGVVSIALALDERGELVADPEYDLIGLPERDAEGKAMADVIATVIDQTIQSLPRQRRRDPDSVGESVRRAVRSAVAERWGKKPMCHVHVLPV